MLLAVGLVFGGALFSQAQKAGESERTVVSQTQKESEEAEKEPVDYRAALIYSDRELMRSLGIDERAQILVGDVAFHHNGTVISCDSAVKYYATNRMFCYNNVIVNRDSSYVYGNSAEYNGDANMATIFSPVVKVVDGDAILYTTQKFSFNTADKIGYWTGGGVVYQEDNVMEAEKGYFFSDLHEMVGVQGVQMKNDSHELISDSVRYNTETKIATFYTRTYIWTKEGEMIAAEKGRYNTQDSTYFFRDNAYMLDEFREMWADTIDFNARVEDAVLYGNAQIDDNEHDSSVFGDLVHYWGERGETRITRHPSMLNYDADQGNTDTLYMRADTIYMFVRYPSDSSARDSLSTSGVEAENIPRSFDHLKWVDSLSDSVRVRMADSLAEIITPLRTRIAEFNGRADSIMNTLYPPEPEPAVEPMPAETDSLSESVPVAVDSLPEPSPVAESIVDSLPVADSLPATDSLSTVFVESLLTPPSTEESATPVEPAEPEPAAPERIEPPEVLELRLQVLELTAEVDRLAADEGYIRPKSSSGGSSQVIPAADSLLRLRLDSTARADSLVRIDSIRIADPKAYKALEKAEVRRLKAQKARLVAEQREAKFAEKAEKRAEKARLRAEERAANVTEKVSLFRRILGRKAVERGIDSTLSDSLARADSLLRLDSLLKLKTDSLAPIDSLPARDSVAADSTLRIFRGWRNVKIWRTDMQAVADSLVGFSVDSTLHMYIDPILWHGDNQVTADSLTLYTVNQQIEHAEFFGDPIMGSQVGDSSFARQFNQVKGERMTSWFVEGELRRHNTNGNAEALYYVQEEERGADGRTVMSDAQAFLPLNADSMSFRFEADSLRFIIAYWKPNYNVLPMDQIPGTQPTELQGFRWQIERQPALSDVFDRRVRPSERATYEAIAKPAFPIAERIDNRREFLIQNRMWVDRTDPLPAYAIEFRRQRYREE
jgi:lipopolysaccharide export system protein LptA